MFGHQQQQIQLQIQHKQRLGQLQQRQPQPQLLKTTQSLQSQFPRQHQINLPRFPLSPSMENLCPVPQAALLAPKSMLQGAEQQRMQANIQGFAMCSGLPLTFLATGPQRSLLRPAPVPQDLLWTKRDYEQIGNANGKLGTSKTDSPGGRTTNTEVGKTESDGLLFAQSQKEPEFKKQKTNGFIHRSDEHVNVPFGHEAVQTSNDKRPIDVLKPTVVAALDYGGEYRAAHGLEECGNKSRASDQVLGIGSSLKVTIQHSSECRAFSTGLEEPCAATGPSSASWEKAVENDPDCISAPDRHYCYICSISCLNQQDFQSHMNGAEHQRRMLEFQHMSNACLVNLLPRDADSQNGTRTGWEEKTGGQRWCATCQTHFGGNLIEHRKTKEHKLSKQSSRPFCTICKRHFRTPRKFVEHMNSREHKQQVEELREEGEPDVLEELITVDAVGCFEGEDDFEEETHEDDDSRDRQPGERHVALEDIKEYKAYDSETQYGSSFVVPVAGFLCRLCHKFFHFESTARHFHCKSLMHFQNVQKYKALKSQKCSVTEDTGKTFSQTSGEPLTLRYFGEDTENIRKYCPIKSIMAGDCTHATPTKQIFPIVSTLKEAGLDNISTTTQQISHIVSTLEMAVHDNISSASKQVSEPHDVEDSVLQKPLVANHRPHCYANQSHTST